MNSTAILILAAIGIWGGIQFHRGVKALGRQAGCIVKTAHRCEPKSERKALTPEKAKGPDSK